MTEQPIPEAPDAPDDDAAEPKDDVVPEPTPEPETDAEAEEKP